MANIKLKSSGEGDLRFHGILENTLCLCRHACTFPYCTAIIPVGTIFFTCVKSVRITNTGNLILLLNVLYLPLYWVRVRCRVRVHGSGLG